jgi:hypothetical protein
MDQDPAYLAADAEDARAALRAAVDLLGGGLIADRGWRSLAEDAYRFLRSRDSLRAIRLQLLPGTPYMEGSTPVTATIDLSDTDELPFTLTGLDAKDAQVAAPADTWNWVLSDPDNSGATLTVSADTTSATVAAGTPTANLSLSVTGANTGLQGAEAIIVQATAATTIGLVAGTPEPEPAPA